MSEGRKSGETQSKEARNSGAIMYAVYLTGAFGELVRLPFRWRTWQGAAAVACRYLAQEGWVGYRVRRVRPSGRS
jgi:hypothetical protein